MVKRYTYEEVKNFIEVESNSGCKLISEQYINSKTKLKIQCKCGNIFYKSLNIFKTQKRQCPSCSSKKVHGKYTYIRILLKIIDNFLDII